MPDTQPALDLVCLGDAFLHHGERLEKHGDILQSLWDLHHEIGAIYVVLSQVAVQQVNATLKVSVVGRHVVRADDVVNTLPWPPNRSHNVIATSELRHPFCDFFDDAEAFVS